VSAVDQPPAPARRDAIPASALALRSLVTEAGRLLVSLVREPVPAPSADQVLVRVEASPINPSDLGLLFGAADMETVVASHGAEGPSIAATIPEPRRKGMAGRAGRAMPVGNEGAGVVVAAGASPAAQRLLGRVVAAFAGGMYAQYRVVDVRDCLPLPDGTTPAEGASAFINPLTALGMVETMRLEGHTALVHTAAASNLGQMLNRICIADRIPLVAIVRSRDQAELLRGQGARHVVESGSPAFAQDLTDAIAATGATLAFDAIGGGPLAGQILGAMETVLARDATTYSRYGSPVHKQVYVYGSLDPSPTVLARNYGMAWGVGGWLLWPFLERIGPDAAGKLRERVAAGIRTTFASHYAREVSLAGMLDPAEIAVYGRRATQSKYLVNPARDASATR
jgi:NADPH2:quinone reductase